MCIYSRKDMVKELPLKTILSSQANRFRGAAFLSGIQDGIVVEIGETTTNVGVIKCGHPSECLKDFKVYLMKPQSITYIIMLLNVCYTHFCHENFIIKVSADYNMQLSTLLFSFSISFYVYNTHTIQICKNVAF